MQLAYLISAYKYPTQLIRLVNRLNTPRTMFFIHVDKKTDDAIYRAMVDGLIGCANVHFVQRHRCEWGGFGHVAATLQCIDEMIATRAMFDYAILLTGQDYPIKSNRFIDTFLEEHRGELFLEFFALPNPAWQNRGMIGGMERIEAWHWQWFGRYFHFPSDDRLPIKRKFPNGIQPYGGSSYWCLPRESIAYVHDFIQRNRRFVDFFRSVDVPDEIFFQTILLNSIYRDLAVNDDLRFIEWRDADSGSPRILAKNDFEKIKASPKLFARKFDVNVDADIFDWIDQEILVVG